MQDRDKIEEILHYFNIDSEIDSVYGNWVVAKNGDVVNYLYPYAILSIHINDTNWLQKMRMKFWFKPECEDALLKALQQAEKIIINNKKIV